MQLQHTSRGVAASSSSGRVAACGAVVRSGSSGSSGAAARARTNAAAAAAAAQRDGASALQEPSRARRRQLVALAALASAAGGGGGDGNAGSSGSAGGSGGGPTAQVAWVGDAPSASDPRARSVVVTVDNTAASLRAVQWALGNLYRDGDVLHLLHVLPAAAAMGGSGINGHPASFDDGDDAARSELAERARAGIERAFVAKVCALRDLCVCVFMSVQGTEVSREGPRRSPLLHRLPTSLHRP